MKEFTTRIDIARPVHEVFAFVSDQTNAPQWHTGLHEVRKLTEGPLGVGSEFEFVRSFAGRRVTARNRFVAFEPDRYVQFEILDSWFNGRASYLAEANQTGGTALTSWMQFLARGLMALLEPVLLRLLVKGSEHDEQRLRQLLESESSPL